MKAKLALSLAANQLLMEVVHAPVGNLRKLARAVLPRSRPKAQDTAPMPPARVAYAGPVTAADLPAHLNHAFERLQTRHAGSFAGAALEVQLGLDHAHIGVMTLDVEATALTSATREAYAQAWVAQMLHLDPGSQIVRSQILADAHKLLVSCVDRSVFELLQAFAEQHRLRFASCRAAVLSAIAAQRESKEGTGLTVVWTEPGAEAARCNSVQLLRFNSKQLVSSWRGWAPLVADGADAALEGAVRRFQAHHAVHPGESVKHLVWPSTAAHAVQLR